MQSRRQIAELDLGPYQPRIFTIENNDGEIGFDENDLHNIYFNIKGIPVVLVVGEPDENTYRLLGLKK